MLESGKPWGLVLRFQTISAVIDVLDAALDEGANGFMCTTHDRIALVCEHLRAHTALYRGFKFKPFMPYAHMYANSVTERGGSVCLSRSQVDRQRTVDAVGGAASPIQYSAGWRAGTIGRPSIAWRLSSLPNTHYHEQVTT